MKKILLLLLTTVFVNSLNAGKPNIPKGINKDTFCDLEREKYGHVIILIDLTTDLDSARKEFIKDQVFSEEFYLKYDPFTKFSYFLINHKKYTENKFLFSKCRPKNGSSKSKKEKATIFENSKVLSSYFKRFSLAADKKFEEIFSTNKDAPYSYIYETIAYIFQNPKSDFTSEQPYRELIIVSDLMQNTTRLSFYNACSANSNQAKCPTFSDFMKNLSDKDYLLATSPNGKGINLQMIYLNYRKETSKEIDVSLKNLWKNYFKKQKFNVKKIISQLDIEN